MMSSNHLITDAKKPWIRIRKEDEATCIDSILTYPEDTPNSAAKKTTMRFATLDDLEEALRAGKVPRNVNTFEIEEFMQQHDYTADLKAIFKPQK